jgi:FimV-like protein
VEVYESEREQLDALKKWWQQNGKAIIIGATLGLGSLIGWQQWQANTQAARESASLEYDVLLADLEKHNFQGVKDRGANILNKFQGTPYAALTALALAKVNVESGDLTAARAYLQQVIDQTDQPQLQHVARLRMAQLMLEEGQAQQALDLVKSVDVAGFSSAYDELKGDIFAALGNVVEARSAYERAIASMDSAVDQSTIKMKLDDLGETEVNI